jgi:dynactin-4
MIDADSAFVLYVDHQGHPAPLSLSYHATASRRLASSINRHPPSTVTEVDSAYCPQCLTFHDANSAATMGYCPKSSCRLCPLCNSVASIAVEESECFYKCGLQSCNWTSRECSLVKSVTVDSEGVISKEDLEKASAELATQLTVRTEECNKPSAEHFTTMLKTLEGMAKEQVKGQRSKLHYSTNTSATARRGLDGPEGWSVESLETSLQTRRDIFSASVGEQVGGQDSQAIPLDQEQLLQESLQEKSVQSLFLQGVARQANSANDLLPLPIPLRPRKSRRCRAELAEARPGILLKPKLNPLEGDSSLRTGHGQWWKKVRIQHGSLGLPEIQRVNILLPSFFCFCFYFSICRTRVLFKYCHESEHQYMHQMEHAMPFCSRYPIPRLGRFDFVWQRPPMPENPCGTATIPNELRI